MILSYLKSLNLIRLFAISSGLSLISLKTSGLIFVAIFPNTLLAHSFSVSDL